MKVRQYVFHPDSGWQSVPGSNVEGESIAPHFLLAFGSGNDCNGDLLLGWRAKKFPGVPVLGCSTAGEIRDIEISNNTIIVTAVELISSRIKIEHAYVKSFRPQQVESGSFQAGKYLGAKFPAAGLRLLFVLSDGTRVNGSELVAGLKAGVGNLVPITGGLAGDGKRFSETQVIVNDRYGPGLIGAIGFYGEQLEVGYGSAGGWDPFGPERRITRSRENVLYELDGRSALSLYKEYLGEYAQDLPASGLLFPLSLRDDSGHRVVRTLLGVNEAEQSMTFAGNLPEGAYVRLMRANLERLIEGAFDAARLSQQGSDVSPELALLISCVGRRLVLQQRAEEELEEVREVLGKKAALTGFYSYGEISPLTGSTDCTFHNQTMTITTLGERAP